jgi:hypothetical protein
MDLPIEIIKEKGRWPPYEYNPPNYEFSKKLYSTQYFWGDICPADVRRKIKKFYLTK